MGIRVRFDSRKAIEVLLHITSQIPDMYHALKVLYFADKKHLAQYGRLICGDSYVAMRLGPVPSGTYDLVKSARGDGICSPDVAEAAQEAFSVEGNNIKPTRLANENLLSESDVECLDWAIAEYGRKTMAALIEISHKEPAYEKSDENDFISLESIVESLPDSKGLMDHLKRC